MVGGGGSARGSAKGGRGKEKKETRPFFPLPSTKRTPGRRLSKWFLVEQLNVIKCKEDPYVSTILR